MKTGVGASHAKTILLGEHSVVYGKPAIAFPILSLGLKATATQSDNGNYLDTPFHSGPVAEIGTGDESLEQLLAETALRNIMSWIGPASSDRAISVKVEGLIPPARGLGSSAAVAGAVIKSVANLHGLSLTSEEQFELVQSVERVAHGTPSGLDAYATSTDVPIWFEKGRAKPLRAKKNPALLVADTGIPGHTVEAVSNVRSKRNANTKEVDELFDKIADLTVQGGSSLEAGEFRQLGSLMNQNHAILRDLGVSNDPLENLVATALEAGAIGAKLTGGGLGGCIVVLGESEDTLTEIATSLIGAGANKVWNVNQAEGNF